MPTDKAVLKLPEDLEDRAIEDARTLAEARRIQDDDDRSEAVRRLLRKKRRTDVLIGEGSLAARIRARRQAFEAGDIEGAPGAFRKGEYND